MLRRPVESAQYASALHQALLARHGLVGSMSRKGNCWDNAVMERFFLSLKTERVWQRDYANHAEAMTDIADYIVGFYNSVRLHSKLGNLPPNAFEQKSAIKHPIVVSDRLDHHTVRAQQEVDRLAGLVDRAVEIFPLTTDLDVSLIHTPAQADWALALAKHQGERGQRS